MASQVSSANFPGGGAWAAMRSIRFADRNRTWLLRLRARAGFSEPADFALLADAAGGRDMIEPVAPAPRSLARFSSSLPTRTCCLISSMVLRQNALEARAGAAEGYGDDGEGAARVDRRPRRAHRCVRARRRPGRRHFGALPGFAPHHAERRQLLQPPAGD